MPAHITHGHTLAYGRTPTYSSWLAMMGRCTVKTNGAYHRYGGNGISVCERWRDFRNFLADMGERPAGKTLDRIDNAKGYELGNCRWVTPKAQARNRKNSVFLTHDGRTMTIPEWSEETGISIDTIRYRTSHGWTVARALTEALHPCGLWKRG